MNIVMMLKKYKISRAMVTVYRCAEAEKQFQVITEDKE